MSRKATSIMSRRLASISLALAIVASPALAGAVTVTLAWDANTEPELTGYRIYQLGGCSDPAFVQVLEVGLVTTATITGLPQGKHGWVATAYDSVGNESGYSNCVEYAPPHPPGNLRLVK